MKILIENSARLIENTSLEFKRYLIHQLPWNERLVGIKGSRGVGKTTLILQYIKQNYGISHRAIYISLDNIYFSNNTLSDFVRDFVGIGGEHLFIDEVHKYKNWAIELKNIYDTYLHLKVCFTSSSLLEILNSRADLSRRALVYEMKGLSFREYLDFRHQIKLDSYTLEDVISNHTQIALKIGHSMKPLYYFESYLKTGYFPFYENNEVLYYKRLQEIINMILEIELPILRNTDISIVSKIKQMLYIISQSVPFNPNVNALANKIQVTRKTILDYIYYLNDARIFSTLNKSSFGVSLLQKPEKLFLENTNFMYAISSSEPNIGNLRETFFLNQLTESHKVTYPEKGDFLVDEKYTFEVGGKNKSDEQIKGIPNAFLAIDNVEFSGGNTIPLWLFGFMY